ncbi:MAG: PLDc_N domain-containing protein [Halanaerobiales bacterium]|nr:PLDc_N domain-containing protein [Halanaerobiales bacterium]
MKIKKIFVCIIILMTIGIYNTSVECKEKSTMTSIIKLFTESIKKENLSKIVFLVENEDLMKNIYQIQEKYYFFELEENLVEIKQIDDDYKKIKVKFTADVKRKGGIINSIVSFKSTFCIRKIEDEWRIIDTDFYKQLVLAIIIGYYLLLSIIITIPFLIHVTIYSKNLNQKILWTLILIFGNVFGIILYCLKKHMQKISIK